MGQGLHTTLSAVTCLAPHSLLAGFAVPTCMARCRAVGRVCITMCMARQPQISVLQAVDIKLRAALEAKQEGLVCQLEREQVSGVSWHR